jgi:hypothetical protein
MANSRDSQDGPSVCGAALRRRTIFLALLEKSVLTLDRRDKKKDS